jgi:hypothetical protein
LSHLPADFHRKFEQPLPHSAQPPLDSLRLAWILRWWFEGADNRVRYEVSQCLTPEELLAFIDKEIA